MSKGNKDDQKSILFDYDWGVHGEVASDGSGGTVFGEVDLAVPWLGRVEGEFTYTGNDDFSG